jgi:broad specificity phosphatase PhoE
MRPHAYLIRHGETLWSETGQCDGRVDVPLSDHGREQARQLQAPLREIVFAHVLVSPLARVRETCALAGLGPAAKIDPDLVEWSYGDFEGKTPEEIQSRRPGWNLWEHGAPGGESPADVSARADSVIARLEVLPGPIAVFSHGQFLRAVATRWMDWPLLCGRALIFDAASVSVLGLGEGGKHVLAVWNYPASGGLPKPQH